MTKQKGICSKCKEAIEPDAQRCKHCKADLRNWFLRHKIITGILTFFVLVIAISNTSSSSDSKAQLSAPASNGSEQSVTDSDKAKEWASIAKLSTQESKQSETFSLQGGQQKLIYETTGGDISTCLVYIMKEGTTLDENGGFPEVMIDGAKKDETLLRKSKGNYYFDVNAAGVTCSVEIQEQR